LAVCRRICCGGLCCARRQRSSNVGSSGYVWISPLSAT